MAEKKISDIFASNPAAAILGPMQFVVNNAGTTEAATADQINAFGKTITTDNRLIKSDGVAGNLQETGITIDDSDNVSDINDLTITGSFTSLGIDDNATKEVVEVQDSRVRFGDASVTNTFELTHKRTDSILVLTGSTSGGFGSNFRLFGNSHSTQANDFQLRAATVTKIGYDDSLSRLTISCDLFLGSVIRFNTYTIATLPTGGVGDHAFATDLRNGAEGAGAGTGGPVYFANSNWRRYEDNAVATA